MRTIVGDIVEVSTVVPVSKVIFDGKKIYAYFQGDDVRVLIRIAHGRIHTSFRYYWSSLFHIESQAYGREGYETPQFACNDYLKSTLQGKKIYEFRNQKELRKFIKEKE